MTVTIGLPQFIWIVYMSAVFCVTVVKHGQKTVVTYNRWSVFMLAVSQFALLWWGGFF